MSIRHDAALRKEDLLAIEKILYTPREKELRARKIFSLKTDYAGFETEVGYDWYDRTGSAKILGPNASAKDVPFVGEGKGGRETMIVYDIATAIRYTRAEREAYKSKAAYGKGPSVSLDTTRVSTARRYVAETENRLCFVGDKKHSIPGLLNKDGIKSENVAEGATGSTSAAKRSWSNKTPLEILNDIRIGRKVARVKGLFRANMMLVSPDEYNELLRPFSEHSDRTVLDWLRAQKDFHFDEILECDELDKEHNGFGVNAFCILDNDPEVMQLSLVKELFLGEPLYDIRGTSEQEVCERTAGLIVRHPSAIYVGKGI